MADIQKIQAVQDSVNSVIKGKEDVVKKVFAAVIAGGHILMEDIPGVGKTTLATAFARTLSMEYKRVQFTPDVLPSDILGFSMYNSASKDFEYRPGSIFSNLFLADEINRTSPKTQSALLEVMEEGKATVDGVTRVLPKPFLVIATQNPIGASGTQKLPESQLDRFMIRLSMGYPSHESAINILKGDSHEIIDQMNSCIQKEELLSLQQAVRNIYVSDALYEYAVSLSEATRNPDYFTLGLSPRGSIALLKMAKAHAFISERDFCTPEDFRDVFLSVANHRILLSTRAKAEGLNISDALMKAFNSVAVPKIK